MIKLIKVLSCVAILAIGINVKANENEKTIIFCATQEHAAADTHDRGCR